jgi:hypothetical protein
MQMGWVKKLCASLALICAVFTSAAMAQTEGFIYKPVSTPEGRSILDPNNTGNVFIDGIPFFGLPELQSEPPGDPRTGATGGHTELIAGEESPAAFMYYDSENQAVLFRVRLAGQSTASKGYSFLFNTEFEAFGPKSSNFSQSNPGFQFEVVLETGTGVTLYELDRDGVVSSQTLSGGENPYFQKAISDLTSEGVPGYFYDFYIPLSEFGGMLSPDDGFRAVASTITRAQSGITGTLSDIAGVDDRLYRSSSTALVSYIESMPETTLNDISGQGSGFLNMVSAMPTARVPAEGEGSLSGSSVEADGTIITIRFYDDEGQLTGTETAAVTNNVWSVSGLDPLIRGHYITVEADASNKEPSGVSEPVFVRSLAQLEECTSPLSFAVRGGNTFSGFVQGIPADAEENDLIIRFYEPEGETNKGSLYISTSDDDFELATEGIANFTSFTAADGGIEFEVGSVGGNSYANIDLFVTAQYAGECESQAIETGTEDSFISETPEIFPSQIEEGDTSVSGISAEGAAVTLFVNGVDTGSVTAGSDGEWTFTGLDTSTFTEGDDVTAQALDPGENALPSAYSNTVTVGTDQTLPPEIIGEYLNGNRDIKGFSAEGGSVEINVYINGVLAGNTITDAFGNWDFILGSGTLETGDLITASAQAPGKSGSVLSEETVVLADQSSPPSVVGPIQTGDPTVEVAGSGDLVTLYIDGEPIADREGPGTVLFEEGTDYEPGDLYSGAVITAVNRDELSTESEPSNAVTVEGVVSFLIEYVDDEGHEINEGEIATQTPNEPFYIRITALDNNGDTFTNFTGSVTLDAGFGVSEGSFVSAGFDGGVLAVHQVVPLEGADNVSVTVISQDNPGVSGESNNFDILGDGFFEVELTLGSCWRTLSSPVQNAAYADLLEPVWTQGAEGSDHQPGDPNVFVWPLAAGNDSDENWQPVTDLNEEIPTGSGFLVSVFSDNNFDGTDDTEPITITVSGYERLADVSPPLNENDNGWTMVGNPYTGSIDFNRVARNSLTDVAYVYDRNGGGTANGDAGAWKTYSVTSGGELTDGLISPFQGFFIQNDGEDASLTFSESARISEDADFYGKERTRNFVRLELEGEGLINSAWITFSDNGENELLRGDALQLTPFSSDYAMLATKKENLLLDAALYPSVYDEIEIPVIAETTVPGSYTISASDLNLPADASLVFIDLQENQSVPITDTFRYEFQVQTAQKLNTTQLACNEQSEVLANTFQPQKAIVSSERFVIRAVQDDAADLPAELSLKQNYPNPFNPSTTIRYELPAQSDVEIAVYDLTGRRIVTLVNGNAESGRHSVEFDASHLASGVYIYRLTTAGQVFTRKLTLIK